MIYLGGCLDNIQIVADQCESRLHDFMFNERKNDLRIKGVKGTYDTYFDKMVGKVDNGVMRKSEKSIVLAELYGFKEHFREIVLAGEKELDEYSRKKVSNYMKKLMVKLYTDFTQDKDAKGISNAHYFFRALNLLTCPYCNRHYIFTLDKRANLVSPEYDHFYDKSSHPLLAVSFYNLVPSCHTCNHVKGTKNTAKVNPYFSGFKSKFELQDDKGEKRLSSEEILKRGGGRIGFDNMRKPRIENEKKTDEETVDSEEPIIKERGNVETFGLQGLYEMHSDYISELVGKVIAYNPTVRQALVDAFQDQAYSPQQVYDFVWGRYLEEAQYRNRPLSKLTKDVLEQLGILPDDDFQ